ncbi:MAG: LysR family transcriptional regulator [Xanthobacteraceae bacterium]|nr:LysR family transcriptional regulator [Xanthobacteraceae bacterium]
MVDTTLRQIRAIIAVCEEGSFTRAAKRENATQSGISQHISAVERAMGVRLFDRSTSGVRPTPAGMRYYRRCVEAVATLSAAAEEMRALAGRVSGNLRIGLMPTFTRAALAPALKDYVREHPDVKLRIVEGYSGVLTEMVFEEELDFAVVPTFEGRVGLKSRLLARDREMLISGKNRGFKPLAPVRLADVLPLKLVAPGLHNIRRRNLETYFETNGIQIEDLIEMDAMIGTLEFVAQSYWVTILPALICVYDLGKGDLVVNPIVDPPLYAEFVVIEPARRTLSVQAQLFLECLKAEVERIREVWSRAGLKLETA